MRKTTNPENNKYSVVGVRFTTSMRRKLQKLANEKDIAISTFIRHSIEQMLRKGKAA